MITQNGKKGPASIQYEKRLDHHLAGLIRVGGQLCLLFKSSNLIVHLNMFLQSQVRGVVACSPSVFRNIYGLEKIKAFSHVPRFDFSHIGY